MLLRAAAAVAVITLLTVGATATAGMLAIEDLAFDLRDPGPPVEGGEEVPRAEAGDPQTILLVGSDRRYEERDIKGAARSDTLMLVRLDPDERVISVLSIPRDLRVDIPGVGTRKINDAYSEGGTALSLRTVRELTDLEINHVVEVNFRGFRQLVDAIGCVYVDVDRRYYHSNDGLPQSQHYAEIDVPAGLQRLCGQDALDLARFRHDDNDVMRAARQQNVLRAAKDQLSTGRLISNRKRLLRIFANATRTDRSLATTRGLLTLLKLALYTRSDPVRQVPFPARFVSEDGADYVVASDASIRRTVRRFLHAPAPTKPEPPKRASTARKRSTGLVPAPPVEPEKRVGFPFRRPSELTRNGRYETQAQVYEIRDRAGKPHPAYRLVVTESRLRGRYYGVQGTTWKSPPVLAHPTDFRRVRGRRLALYETGGRLRYVAWRTDRAVYWIANTVDLHLRNDQMLAIASGLRR
jgi:LCP family protein required for cell wall assembly